MDSCALICKSSVQAGERLVVRIALDQKKSSYDRREEKNRRARLPNNMNHPLCQRIASSGRNGCPLTKSLPQSSKTNACNNLVARCSSTTRRMMPPSALGQAFTKMPDMAKGLLTDTLDMNGRLLKSCLTIINYSYCRKLFYLNINK